MTPSVRIATTQNHPDPSPSAHTPPSSPAVQEIRSPQKVAPKPCTWSVERKTGPASLRYGKKTRRARVSLLPPTVLSDRPRPNTAAVSQMCSTGVGERRRRCRHSRPETCPDRRRQLKQRQFPRVTVLEAPVTAQRRPRRVFSRTPACSPSPRRPALASRGAKNISYLASPRVFHESQE